jgi:6-phosphogluconolactonase (cycloisomerase 2 family)
MERRMHVSTRRRFLHTLAGAAAAPAFVRQGQARRSSPRRPVHVYVGTYSQGSATARGKGIHIFDLDPESGALSARGIFETPLNPSWLALNAKRTHLYSANAVAGAGPGSVSAHAIDAATGQLTLLNTVSSEGSGPAHMSLHSSGKYALVANYDGGTSAVLPIHPSGELGSAIDVKRHEGKAGPAQASTGPPGSFAISGHDRAHAHMIQSDASGRFVFAADLGLDQILVWRFDDSTGTLMPHDPPSVGVPPGDGPRHFVFHPNGRWFYSIQEEASTLITFDYDAAHGTLRPKQTLSTLPKEFAGTSFTSEVMLSPDARFLYAANRLHDSIAWFSIAGDGQLTLAGEEWTRGDYPRSFNIEPAGHFLFSCNQRSDAVASFRINEKTGALTFTGRSTPVGTPSHIVFAG